MPEIIFLESDRYYLTGIGVRRVMGEWRYYAPFVEPRSKYPCHRPCGVRFAWPLSEDRVIVFSDCGEMAMIDLLSDGVTSRLDLSNGDEPFAPE